MEKAVLVTGLRAYVQEAKASSNNLELQQAATVLQALIHGLAKEPWLVEELARCARRAEVMYKYPRDEVK